MRLGGLQKCSLVDYPGYLAAVVFTQGCPWRCVYCHNGELVKPECFGPPLPVGQVLEHLEQRRGQLEGVVITGGEPTLQPGLPRFLAEVKGFGYRVKLDTNGMYPLRLATVLETGTLDYVAMDLKAPLADYARIAGTAVDAGALEESIELIRSSGIDYDFRTTVLPGLHDAETLRHTLAPARGARRYALQRFVPEHTLEPARSRAGEERCGGAGAEAPAEPAPFIQGGQPDLHALAAALQGEAREIIVRD